MSFRGKVQAACPQGCDEEQEVEVWTFVRGDVDESLRESLMAGDLNVVACPDCGGLFIPESALVYVDAAADLTVFVFPESYRADEGRWRARMREDFEKMAPVTRKLGLESEPVVFFGLEGLRELLQSVSDQDDEVRVATALARELGFAMHRVGAAFARERRLPPALPWGGSARTAYARKDALKAVRALVKANDALEGYRRWEEYLAGDGPEPPARKSPPVPEKA